MTHNIPIGNWTPYVQSDISGKESASFIVGKSGGGTTDPAYGCKKMFTSTYQCGNGPSKVVNLSAEAWAKPALFDCTAENKMCSGFKLTLGDDGNMTVTDGNGKTLWSSNTNKTGLALPQFSAAKSKFGRNYLLSGEVLNIGDFIGSPSGNCYLMMTATGFQLLYNMTSCDEKTGQSNDENAFATFDVSKVSTTNIGKVGYVSNNGKIHEYPDSMVSQGTDYTLIGNYDSAGNNIKQLTKTTLDQCKQSCNDLDECYGFVYQKANVGVQPVAEETCWLKNAEMFPKGLRQPNDDYELYTRSKVVKNNNSCTKTTEPSTAAQWELLPMGEKMAMSTLCSLGAITEQEQKDLAAKHTTLSSIADLLGNKLKGLTQEKHKLDSSIKTNVTKLQTDIDTYSDIKTKTGQHVANADNIDGMLTDTDLNMISQNYKHILWTILAILFIMGGIKMARGGAST